LALNPASSSLPPTISFAQQPIGWAVTHYFGLIDCAISHCTGAQALTRALVPPFAGLVIAVGAPAASATAAGTAAWWSTTVAPNGPALMATLIGVTGSVGAAFSGGNCELCEDIPAWPAEVQLAIQEGIAEATALYQRLAPDVSPFSN
jgi:hypothetical protein